MFWFYLRTPAFTTRYLLDFAPGFAVLMAIAWFAAVSRLRDRWRIVCILALGAWMGCEIVVAQKFGQSPFSLSWPQVVAIRGWADARSPAQPIHIGNETTSSVRSGIPYDSTGWIRSTGRVLPYVNVFVEDARFLELELARAPETAADPDPLWVKAKIGLEFLERESVARTGDMWRIRFKGPTRASYRTGIQSAFIMFVPDTNMADKRTPWILRRVRWRDPVHGETNQIISDR
jgi:hypothetical protein